MAKYRKNPRYKRDLPVDMGEADVYRVYDAEDEIDLGESAHDRIVIFGVQGSGFWVRAATTSGAATAIGDVASDDTSGTAGGPVRSPTERTLSKNVRYLSVKPDSGANVSIEVYELR